MELYEEPKETDEPIEQMVWLELSCSVCHRSVHYSEVVASKECDHVYCKYCQKPEVGCGVPKCKANILFFLSNTSSNCNYIACPNCKIYSEIVTSNEPVLFTGRDNRGQKQTREQLKHYTENRIKCAHCSVDYCKACRTAPYHLNLTCQEFSSLSSLPSCSFCSLRISHPKPSNSEEWINCKNPNCIDAEMRMCGKIRNCGHKCRGVKSEAQCIDVCFECEHQNNPSQEKPFCQICQVSKLESEPSIKLHSCGHIFHYSCVVSKLGGEAENLVGGANDEVEGDEEIECVNFSKMQCAICNTRMSHPLLSFIMAPQIQLEDEIHRQAAERNFLPKDFSPNTPVWALVKQVFEKHSWYICFKCKKPYYGGKKFCVPVEQKMRGRKDDLLCGGCCAIGQNREICDLHGKEYLEWKCRYCCERAVWFCWGTTHFCNNCHSRAAYLITTPKEELERRSCVCNEKHPPHGTEYCFGCALCRMC